MNKRTGFESGSRYEDIDYSRNQCSILIRIDGEELQVPVNFGMTADDIRLIYPYLLQLTSKKMTNPAIDFANRAKTGDFNDMTDDEYDKRLNVVKHMARFWYDKSEASLLDIAIRIALDLKFKDIEELASLFDIPNPIEDIEAPEMTDEEVEDYIKETGLETEVDDEFDAGDEQDIPLGIAGGLTVDLYDDDDDYLSEELDAMEADQEVTDEFAKILDDDVSEDSYKSSYEKGKLGSDESFMSIYDSDGTESVLDKVDKADGLNIDTDEDVYSGESSDETDDESDLDFASSDMEDEDEYDPDEDDNSYTDESEDDE